MAHHDRTSEVRGRDRSGMESSPAGKSVSVSCSCVQCVRARRSCVGGREEGVLRLRRGQTK
eukprot:9050205-Pyramimonas_sp.AAC.1